MKKYLKINKEFIKVNFEKDIQYRFEAFFNLIPSVVYMLTFVFMLYFSMGKIGTVKGFSFDNLLICLILGQLWWQTVVIFVRKNFQFLGEAINKGILDSYLLKPIDIRMVVPFWQFDFRSVISWFLTLALLIIFSWPLKLSFGQIILATIFFINGVSIIYFITSIFVSMFFWIGRNNAIFDVQIELPDIVRLPLEFFPTLIRGFFIFGFPIILVINPTFQIIYNKFDITLLSEALIVNFILILLANIIWQKGLENYSSGG